MTWSLYTSTTFLHNVSSLVLSRLRKFICTSQSIPTIVVSFFERDFAYDKCFPRLFDLSPAF